MKAVTEFPSFVLTKGLNTMTTLTSSGKTPEEVQAGLGEAFKFENEKLKHFVAAIDVASKNATNLRRVLVLALNEGEAAPAKAVKVEEHYYLPELLVMTAPKMEAPTKGGRPGGNRGAGGKGGDKKGPKPSPWGMSPEEIAAKKAPKAPKA